MSRLFGLLLMVYAIPTNKHASSESPQSLPRAPKFTPAYSHVIQATSGLQGVCLGSLGTQADALACIT